MTHLIDSDALLAQAQQLVDAARKAGADASDALAIRNIKQKVSVRLGRVENIEHAESADFGLRVFVGDRNASIAAGKGADVAELAARAVAMAEAAPPDPFAGLADPDLLLKSVPLLDLLDPTLPETSELVVRATTVEDAGRAVRGVTNSGGSSAYWSRTGVALVTSHGFAGSYERSGHGHSLSVIAGEGTAMERDWEASGRTHLSDLDPADEVGRKAGERAVRRLNPRKISTRSATVVYDPRVATSLIGALTGAISGSAIARKTSFLKDKRGNRVFPPHIRITDDPSRPRGPATRPFDGEGLAGRPIDLIGDGVLTNWLLDSATARELGLVSNGRAARGLGAPGPSATNVLLHPGDRSPETLIGDVGEGLYVTDFIGHGANLITGDYSRGAAGFWIENGEIAYPVAEITVAGHLLDMFARLIPANDLEYRGSFVAPTVAVEGLTVAGR